MRYKYASEPVANARLAHRDGPIAAQQDSFQHALLPFLPHGDV